MSAKKSITFLSRSAPYGSDRARLCLDMVLAAAVFEQDIQYVFWGDGILQLLSGQQAEAIDSKPLDKLLQTLPLYGVDRVFADAGALANRGLTIADLALDVQAIDSLQLQQLLQDADTVVNL